MLRAALLAVVALVSGCFSEASHEPPPQAVTAGGPVLARPTVVPVFWSNDHLFQGEIEAFLQKLARSPYRATVTSEYGVGSLTIAPTVVTSDPVPPSESALSTWLEAQ